MTHDDNDLLRRALEAYFDKGGVEMPSRGSGVVIVRGLKYVRLINDSGTIAVYRVNVVGHLRRLSQLPKELV